VAADRPYIPSTPADSAEDLLESVAVSDGRTRMTLSSDRMSQTDDERISRINTQWTLLHQAHQGSSIETSQEARAAVVQRYIGPIYRYLNRIMGNADAAEDVAHEVVLILMQGRMAAVSKDRGRFRDYLKSVLANAARAARKRASRDQRVMTPAEEFDAAEEDATAFDHCLRDELLQNTWNDLQEVEHRTQQPFATALRWKTNADRSATAELCAVLASITGREYTEAAARKVLQRARDQFAHLLVERVRHLLPTDQRTSENLEQELRDLGLLAMCRSAFEN
jgi:DNA-directed RNA polymerase specialized sigma24 family protein